MTFQFRRGPFVVPIGLLIIFLLFLVLATIQSGLNEGVAFLALIVVMVSLMIKQVIALCADLVIDDRGISRELFGKQVFYLGWQEIESIRDVVSSVKGQELRFVSVVTRKNYSKSYMSTTKYTKFNVGWMKDFSSFVDLVNKLARARHIKVERIRGGKSTVCDEIYVRDPWVFK